MKTIQPFIDLGFYTVPLQGELRRLDDGKKTIPKFEAGWKTNYAKHFNELPTTIGGVITGAISNIIAIDCDDQQTFDLFRALDSSNDFVFVSRGKPSGGGTILYKYPTGAGLATFSIQTELTHLDFYADNGFIYLPSDANTTKEQWEQEEYSDLPALLEPPAAVVQLIRCYHEQCSLVKKNPVEATTNTKYTNYLAPQIDLLLLKKQFIPSLFKVLTPKSFRDLEQYTTLGYLHPNKVPEGRGSEYMSKLSAILGADSSIDRDRYMQTMFLVNDMWDMPMEKKKFELTVLDPMVDGKSSINGDPIWKYDEHWQTRGLAFTTKLGDAMEVFYDDIRAAYHVLNYTSNSVKVFSRDSDLFNYIEPVAQALPVRKELKMMVPVVRTVLQPSLPFGFFGEDIYTRKFNMFLQTPALCIINNPESYNGLYKRPKATLKFLETFIPNQVTRNYVLGFLKVKLTTFKYSPVVLYMLGVHGSGKDTFVKLLDAIMGSAYIARPTAKEFIEQYNGWLVDKYFVQLDEYGNQLHTMMDKEIALGKIKSYTGKQETQIRQMRTDGFNYKHMATFIMTANSNPLMIEDGDRRVALIDTPNVLKNTEVVKYYDGVTNLITAIESETNDFAYYLATEVNAITRDEYMQPPETAQKRHIIASKLPAAQKLAYYFTHCMFEQLEELAEDASCHEIFHHSDECKVYEDDLMILYTFMTEGRGTDRGLAKILRQSDFEKKPTSRGGVKKWYYVIANFNHYKPTLETLSPINDDKPTGVAGI